MVVCCGHCSASGHCVDCSMHGTPKLYTTTTTNGPWPTHGPWPTQSTADQRWWKQFDKPAEPGKSKELQ